jgi:hypothetical protein
MHKRTISLFAPLAAFAVAGAIGTGPAQAKGDEHGGDPRNHRDSHSAEIVTSEEATATFDETGVTTEAVPPATAIEQEDGTTEFRFPEDDTDHGRTTPGKSDKATGEFEYLGGIEYSSEAGDAVTWEDPEVDTSDGLISFDVDGERVDLLRAVPDQESDKESDDESESDGESYDSYGDDGKEHGDYELVLTDDGADQLNQVAGDDAFEEGDVLATTDDGKDC